jgi:hypothetical protein
MCWIHCVQSAVLSAAHGVLYWPLGAGGWDRRAGHRRRAPCPPSNGTSRPPLPLRCPATPQDPVPHLTAHPNSSNLLEWHFSLEGAAGTDFEGGVYHGRLVFPPTYPFKPPSIAMLTPNGRFAINTKLCLR